MSYIVPLSCSLLIFSLCSANCFSITTTSPSASYQKVPFESCGGQVLEVRAFGCQNNTLPCIMTRGTTGTVEVDFIPPFDTRSLYIEVRGRSTATSLMPIYLPVIGIDSNACVGHGITCPVKKNSKLTYIHETTVDRSVQPVQTDAIWRLTDYWGFTVACFKVDVNIGKLM